MKAIPELVLFRTIKNIAIAIAFILAGLICGIATRKLFLTIIPLFVGVAACIATIKMISDWKCGRIFLITAVCIHKDITVIGHATYIMKGYTDASADSSETINFTLRGMSRNAFSVAGTYELLFRKDARGLSSHNLIDYGISTAYVSEQETGQEIEK